MPSEFFRKKARAEPGLKSSVVLERELRLLRGSQLPIQDALVRDLAAFLPAFGAAEPRVLASSRTRLFSS